MALPIRRNQASYYTPSERCHFKLLYTHDGWGSNMHAWHEEASYQLLAQMPSSMCKQNGDYRGTIQYIHIYTYMYMYIY